MRYIETHNQNFYDQNFYGEKGWWMGGGSEKCLNWGGGRSLRDLSKNILNQGWVKAKNFNTFRLQIFCSNNGATEPIGVVHNCESLHVHKVDQHITECMQKFFEENPLTFP